MRKALITGASRGLGRALAAGLAADGYALVIDGRYERALDRAAARIRADVPGANIVALAGDAPHVVTPETGLRTVDGLLTGLHEPHSSHLRMLAAFHSPGLLADCYDAALAGGYLWHEFGDVHLLLP